MDIILLFTSFAGTLLGVLLGSFFTYKFGLLLYRKQQKTANDMVRKEQIYEPMFADLKYIREHLEDRLDPNKEYSYREEPPLSFYTWQQIKTDQRILLVNNKQLEDSCNKILEHINNYHLFIRKIKDSFTTGIKQFFQESFQQIEISRVFDASLFVLSVTDRRFPLERALDDLFSPANFPQAGVWQKMQEELDTGGLENIQNRLLEYIDYHRILEEHEARVKKVLAAVKATRNLLIKEIRKIIRESER